MTWAPSRGVESASRDSFDLAYTVLADLERAFLTVGQPLTTTRFAIIDAAGVFADDKEIRPFNKHPSKWRTIQKR